MKQVFRLALGDVEAPRSGAKSYWGAVTRSLFAARVQAI
jgi:hypothetical protein